MSETNETELTSDRDPAKGRKDKAVEMTAKDVKRIWEEIYVELQNVVIGQIHVLEDLMICLLAKGHVLLEGVPGVAKTQMTNGFAGTLGCLFKRAQFTPDLLPSDVVGTTVYDPKTGTFKMREGPIFTNILLADEINRAPPKTQAALLEAMAEKQVSIEGETYKLDTPFMVIATQNPVEQEGTYPLPEAQIDRFHMKVIVDLPSSDEELQIIHLKHYKQFASTRRVTTPKTIVRMINFIDTGVHVDDDILTYLRDLVLSTRTDARLILGGSPRMSIALLNTAKAVAAMRGRNYVIPDDVKRVVKVAGAHRLQMKPEAELEGLTTYKIMDDLSATVAVPV